MFTRILAPIDTHPDAIVSVALAEQIARHTHAELYLMRAIPESASPREAAAHRESLERLAADISARGGLEPHIEVTAGRPDARILEAAERDEVDLIILAPHARAGLDALRHRSVTTRLLARTPVPLLVAPEHNVGTWPAGLLSAATALVIVPIDGTALSERAIGIGQRIAETWERPLLLLRVIEPFSLYGAGAETRRLERALSDEDAQQAHSALSSLRARVARQTGVAVEAMVKHGVADRVIAQAADSYPGSLIVMSTHGRKATERAILGSVALNVLRRTHEPTLILPPLAVMRRALAHAGAVGEPEW